MTAPGVSDSNSSDFVNAADPFALFETWLEEAERTEPNDPNAMQVASVDADGLPDVRTVLLKGFDRRGFVFYTNYESAKGTQIMAARKAALVFHWKTRRRQVRARGPVEIVSDEEADAYYASRPRGSRIGAWASEQSRPLASREDLLERTRALEAKYEGRDIPRPPHWGGLRIVPQQIEFWQDGEFRLHDRVVFVRSANGWAGQRMNP